MRRHLNGWNEGVGVSRIRGYGGTTAEVAGYQVFVAVVPGVRGFVWKKLTMLRWYFEAWKTYRASQDT